MRAWNVLFIIFYVITSKSRLFWAKTGYSFWLRCLRSFERRGLYLIITRTNIFVLCIIVFSSLDIYIFLLVVKRFSLDRSESLSYVIRTRPYSIWCLRSWHIFSLNFRMENTVIVIFYLLFFTDFLYILFLFLLVFVMNALCKILGTVLIWLHIN